MPFALLLTNDAAFDLDQLYEYIARNDAPGKADTVLARIAKPFADRGLRWELIQSKAGPGGIRLYTIRVSDKFRAVACRDGQFLRFLSLHADHDSAYR